ncbi:MAG: hypothetical protein JWR81_5688 [Pseudonocardia sp.]|nr:hypothetical protein [Pseudonocardia sp.]
MAGPLRDRLVELGGRRVDLPVEGGTGWRFIIEERQGLQAEYGIGPLIAVMIWREMGDAWRFARQLGHPADGPRQWRGARRPRLGASRASLIRPAAFWLSVALLGSVVVTAGLILAVPSRRGPPASSRRRPRRSSATAVNKHEGQRLVRGYGRGAVGRSDSED